MARGNQRDKAREKNLKDAASQVRSVLLVLQTSATPQSADTSGPIQKKKNTQSGTEFARTKEEQAKIMRDKQAAAEAKKNEGGSSKGVK